MKVLTLLNEKGGVGKTTLATHIAAGLAGRGHSVLLVDACTQGHSTRFMGLPKWGGVYNLLIQGYEWGEVLREAKPDHWFSALTTGELIVLSGNVETHNIPTLTSDPLLLRERLQELDGRFDVCVIDTAPTPSMFHNTIYVASDYLIFPCTCNGLGLDGLAESSQRMLANVNLRKGFGLPATSILGVQPIRFDARTNESKWAVGQMQAYLPDLVWPHLHSRIVWQSAASMWQTLFAYAPQHEATQEAWKLIDRVQIGMNLGEEVGV